MLKFLKEIKDIKGVFKPPKKKYYIGKLNYGNPYFYPWNFNSTILIIKKEKPKYLRCNSFKLFGYNISYGSPIWITWYGLGWKDKYNSPRYEWSPSFQIYFFNWQFCIFWNAPNDNNDTYYEMVLWYLYYSDKNIVKAEKNWGWINMDGESTWDKNYLYSLKSIRKEKLEKLNEKI
jgi:hypothetical protein